MTIEKKLYWPILSLIHPYPVISSLIKVRKITKVVVKVFNQVVGMMEPPPLMSTLSKLKNRTNNPKKQDFS